MDLGHSTEDVSGEVIPELDDVFDAAAFENEACGICMDIVVDRGVLDCCSHWFCFACIDNWATITNLCPICKKEFQLITCLPVYDTIGNVKVDEHFLSRDDDWYIQGKNNTLSFPSYYINEDAVICLDGDGCKIRNKLSSEEDLNLDTSIACDSCDIWYHAFCVGFDPEQTLENSWLCPRCIDHELPHKVNDISEQKSGNHHDPRNAGTGQSVDSPFSGKVSISVADAGETAIVVSMVEGKPLIRSSESEQLESDLDANTCTEMEALMANAENLSTQFEQCSNGNFTDDGVDKRLTGNIGLDQVSYEFPLGLSSEGTVIASENSMNDLFGSLPSLDALSDRTAIHHDSELETSLTPSTSEVGTGVCDAFEVQVVADGAQPSNSEFSLSVDKLIQNGDEDVSPVDHNNIEVNGSMRNHTEILRSSFMKDAYASDHLNKRERDTPAAAKDCAKKEELDEEFHRAPQRRRIDTIIAINPRECSGMASTSEDPLLRHASVKEDHTSDIMSIVQDNCKSSGRQLSGKRISEKSTTNGRQPGVGLRVKKIMWRVEDDKESSLLVHKLRNEIREAVGNKEPSDISKDGAFDEKLLAAFRAAISRPEDKPASKVDPSLVRGKKSLLRKGKVRENLTKKIYGTANGRRRRAWDRDWEVEFWKHRCNSSKTEKVETLQSVLDLLKKIKSSPENDEMEQGPKREVGDSILSRVYLADSSVLPRTEDLKPLSALTGHTTVGILERQEQNRCSPLSNENLNTKDIRTVSETSSSSQGVLTSHGKGIGIDNSHVKGETCWRKEQSDGSKIGGKSYLTASRNSKEGDKSLKEPVANSDSTRSDKRKWALQILARKNASSNRKTSLRKEDDNPMLKENYPLLAQLPVDMRPVPAPTHRNKVPIPVRQAQLYRLTEHYLRRADVPVICRTADVELAVADAVNVEHEICKRSKSKLVYMNLCSQHTIHSKPQQAETIVSHLTSSVQGTEQVSNEHAPTEMACPALGHDSVEEALRQAGLLSDSAPNSPQSIECFEKEDNPVVTKEKDFENLFDIDPHPDLDIYGDFDYDLDDEDYGGPSKISSCQRESKLHTEDGDMKMKVVLSSVGCERLNSSLDHEPKVLSFEKDQTASDVDKQSTVEAESCIVAKHQHDKDACQSILKMTNDISYPVTESLKDEKYEEPSWQECEELYGLDREDLAKMVYEEAMEAMEATTGNMTIAYNKNDMLKNESIVSVGEHENCGGDTLVGSKLLVNDESSQRESSPTHSLPSEDIATEQISMIISGNKLSESNNSVLKKVEAYIKEHIRPLCKSGVVTVEQYRWAVGKATEKVMKYHGKAKNANFLIKEGDKVKKLAEDYVEASQRKEWKQKLHS